MISGLWDFVFYLIFFNGVFLGQRMPWGVFLFFVLGVAVSGIHSFLSRRK